MKDGRLRWWRRGLLRRKDWGTGGRDESTALMAIQDGSHVGGGVAGSVASCGGLGREGAMGRGAWGEEGLCW
jgi:hypothetical protein